MHATLMMLSLLTVGTPWRDLGLPIALRQVLDRGEFSGTPGGFKAITLSHIADGCAFQVDRPVAARACVEAAFSRAKALFPRSCPNGWCDADALLRSENALALSHLTLILGAADQTGPCLDEALHRELAEGLSRASVEDPWAVIPSYRASPFRWPADQSAVLAALHRADVAHGWTTHVEPLRRFMATIDERGLHRSGLPASELTGAGPGAKYPRGCAQSFISRYLAEVDPARASAWWKTYRAQHLEVLPIGVAGFREWPRGVERKADVDSGPIVLGIGVAASALGISAAKAQGDAALVRVLEGSAERAMSLGVGALVADASFAQAIRFEGRWHPLAPSR